jgi:hypothetical protein
MRQHKNMNTWIDFVQCDHTLCDQFSCDAILYPEFPRRAFLQHPRILRSHECLCDVVIVSYAIASTAHASHQERGALKQGSKECGGLGGTIKGTKRASVDGGPE